MEAFLQTQIEAVHKGSKQGVYTITASTNDVDRHGEVVDIDGINVEAFKQSPRILANHDQNIESIIGRADPNSIKKVGGKLKMNIEFASDISPLADIAEKLVKGGYLNTLSIGFISKEVQVKKVKGVDTVVHTQSELLEVSLVAVPANASAIINPVSKGLCSASEFDTFKKHVKIQEPTEVDEVSELTKTLERKIDVLTDIHEDKKLLTKFFAGIAKTVGYQAVGDIEIDTKELSNIINTLLTGVSANQTNSGETLPSSFINRYKILSEITNINKK